MIPTTLDECMEALKERLSPADQVALIRSSADDLGLYHHGLGQWIRNNWGLWKGGPLLDHMTSLGFLHADDMSMSIIREFWARMNNKPSVLQEDIKKYKEYWDKQAAAHFKNNGDR